MRRSFALLTIVLLFVPPPRSVLAEDTVVVPYDRQVDEHLARLASPTPRSRQRAAEMLGFLRAYRAEPRLVEQLADDSPMVRRQAAMSLGWCGGRLSLERLVNTLDDPNWMVRQAAHVSLTNLTGMEIPFTSIGSEKQRDDQISRWQQWIEGVPSERPPKDVLAMLEGPRATTDGLVTASTTYRGPAGVLRDGQLGPEYWQTKFVDPPQSCTVDLGKPREIGHVIVHQYSAAFVMDEYEVATSLDNKTFESVKREMGKTPVKLVVAFPKREARYVRITSFGSVNPTYPTTFFEIEVDGDTARVSDLDQTPWRQERALRALGVFGGEGATRAIVDYLGPNPTTAPAYRPAVRAGIRSLGRLREETGFQLLLELLDDPFWSRAAAEALGDYGDRRAVRPLLAIYPRFAKNLAGQNPPEVPRDDRMGFPSEDRMLEIPYWIIYSLCRLPLDDPDDLAELRKIATQIMANLPGDHDTHMLYEPEVGHLLTRHLLDAASLRQQAAEHAFVLLGQARRVEAPAEPMTWSAFPPYRISSWLPAVCTEKEDLPRLLALLKHENGWVRLNAAKAIGWLGDPSAIEPLAKMLRQAKAEADYGYNATFKNEEYDDISPRWREGLIRALGLLGAGNENFEHTALLVSILEDERSVVDIRHAAAFALTDLDNAEALVALQKAAVDHPFFCVRNAARDALVAKGLRWDTVAARPPAYQSMKSAPAHTADDSGDGPKTLADVESIVFIKGSNNIPNTIGTVEQADRWRQTYVVTDSGPAYRPGRNFYMLTPPTPEGKVTPLTRFEDGYVAEPELSWDGRHVIFCYRAQDNPWWHIYRIDIDGTDLTQLTFGPYHSVGPAYLPDGRIVFASSQSGIRDEYHGYPCTVLCVMNADGSDMHPIATNIGRDNEPTILADGRVAFSRLEVFYSRNKTELTLHAAHPDGTQDMVLYGPERRQFWRDLDHGPRTPADGQEAPLTHRVLRMTQPQQMPDGRNIVVVTQGGLVFVGQKRTEEEFITPDNKTRAYTTPFPLPDGTILCGSAFKEPDRTKVDLGLYLFDPATKKLELVYNDPTTADFEARPVMARRRPTIRATKAGRLQYSGTFACTSVFATQEPEVPTRGRYVRLIEGMPIVARHSTHTNPNPVWQNHGGTIGRVLGTVPLAPDGSFYVEAPADRLLHYQVLDSDRRVVGNQLTWIYARPGEQRSCIGCHEKPHTTTRANNPLATHYPPAKFLPQGDEFRYRAKAWFKGHLPSEIEERTRTVRSVNLLGR